MKNTHLHFMCFLAALLFVSCAEEDSESPLEANQKVEAWKSDKAPSISLLEGAAGSSDSLMVVGYKENGKIELKVKFNGVGTYKLSELGRVNYYDLIGDDVVTNSYSLDTNDKTSELTITKWNPASKELEATFQVTLKRATAGGASGEAETLRFTGGDLKGTVTFRKEVSWVNVKEPAIKMGSLVRDVDSLSIHLTSETGQLVLRIPFKGVGKYPYHLKLAGFFYEYAAGPMWTSMYEFNPEGESEVEITSWNPNTKQIKGSFKVALKKAYVYWPDKNAISSVTSGELLTFSGGLFEGEVKLY